MERDALKDNDGRPAASGASILIVDDDTELLRALEKTLRAAGYAVRTAGNGEEALKRLAEGTAQLVVTDLLMPGMDGIQLLREVKAVAPGAEVLLMTAHATIERAVEAMRLGAHDFVEKPFVRDRLLLTVERALEKQSLADENRRLRERLVDRDAADRMIGLSAAMREMRRLVTQIASSDVPVLITGENGTGKEVVADLLHSLSTRAKGPLVKISCAAIPENLLESELFGYERGAFSGAQATKRGRFELADHGTLFLDEIGEMAPAMQAKLLRVLQDQCVQRLGSTRDVRVDVRLVCATNVDLSRAMREGKFREDLYHRINVIEIPVPPLRERLDDLPVLLSHFVALHGALRNTPVAGVSDAGLAALARHDWPGNVRELENVVQRALVTAPGPVLEAEDFRFAHYSAGAAGGAATPADIIAIKPGTTLQEAEGLLVADALRRTHGDKERAARMLGISSRTLYRRASGKGIEVDETGEEPPPPEPGPGTTA